MEASEIKALVRRHRYDFDAAAQEAGLPMVRPGDASVAAPFTSRQPSVRHIVDLIRQGRCTLPSALQNYCPQTLRRCWWCVSLAQRKCINATWLHEKT